MKLGPVSYKLSDSDPFLGREIHQQRQFSEKTQEMIDAEMGDTLRGADRRAMDMLHTRREELERLKDALMEREELDENEITSLIGQSIHALKKAENSAVELPVVNDPSVASSVDNTPAPIGPLGAG